MKNYWLMSVNVGVGSDRDFRTCRLIRIVGLEAAHVSILEARRRTAKTLETSKLRGLGCSHGRRSRGLRKTYVVRRKRRGRNKLSA